MQARVRLLLCASCALLLTVLVAQSGAQNPPGDLLLTDPNNATGNASRNCLQKNVNSPCPDSDLHFYLYAGTNGEAEEINVTDPDWLASSRFNPALETMFLIHGYRGGDSLGPFTILKNEYIRQGEHNLIMVDWGEFVRAPCYLQALNNIKLVAKCAAHVLQYLEDSGVTTENVTCVGHSLGAHMCGIIGQQAPMQLNRIIGLDPARPFFSFAWPDDRLDAKDAKIVQVIHTDTGFYGLPNRQGSVDFCVNSGAQPFCQGTRNPQLCSHIHAVCFLAESLDKTRARPGVPCFNSCPSNLYPVADNQTATLGHFLEESASGMYCIHATTPPFCPDSYNQTEGEPTYGHRGCCPVYPGQSTTPTPTSSTSAAPETDMPTVIPASLVVPEENKDIMIPNEIGDPRV